jgi:branched-chain amino acid transport system substrate-binding protein
MLTLVLAGCGNKPVIGVLLCSTGSASTYGASMERGIDLAIEQARADGSFPSGMGIVQADSTTDPEVAVTELTRLVSDNGADLIIAGVTSDEAKAMLPQLERLRILCISPSATAPQLTKESEYFYRVFTSDELEGRRAGRFLYEEKGHANVVIYTPASEQARGIEPHFRQSFETTMGGKVLGRVLINEANWENESADILAAHRPESAYVLGLADQTTLTVVRHLKERGFEGTICVSSAFNSGELIVQNAELVEGIYFPQPAFDVTDERPIAQDFIKAYRDAYQRDPDIYAAHAYDAVRVAMAVLRTAPRLETSMLKKTIQFEIKEFPGVTGILQFDDFGDVHHNPVMFIIKDGQVLNHARYVEEQKRIIRDKIRGLLLEGN